MTNSRRGTHVTAMVTMALTLLSGCAMPAHGANNTAEPDWRHGYGFSPNCVGEPIVVLHEKFDINNDDKPDWLYVFRCPEATRHGRGDQLELLDGQSDPAHPRPLGHHPLIHPDQKITFDAGSCLAFSAGKLLVADKRSKNVPGWRVVSVGTWQKDNVQMRKPAGDPTLPCDQR